MNGKDFYSCDRYTQAGTVDIVQWLQYRYWIIDVQHNKRFQQMDIDFVVVERNNPDNALFFEIKCDSYYRTGNYFAEIIGNNIKWNESDGKDGIGCWMKTQSDFILYYFPDVKELHIIPTQKAQEWTKEHTGDYPKKMVTTTSTHGEPYYSNMGLLIPRNVLDDAVGVETFNLKKDSVLTFCPMCGVMV